MTKTGCAIIDELGLKDNFRITKDGVKLNGEVADFCLECSFQDNCGVIARPSSTSKYPPMTKGTFHDRSDDEITGQSKATMPNKEYIPPKEEEIYIQCESCKTTETLTFINGKLQPTQKWIQLGDCIIHHIPHFGIGHIMGRG